MKKVITILLLLSSIIIAQKDSLKVYKSDLYLGAGGIYPRYMTISDKSIASHNTHGFYLRLGYNVTEHFGFRLTPSYVRLHSFYYGNDGSEIDNFTRMGAINLEAVYNILPCDIISPFVVVGYGITYFKSHMPYLKEQRPKIKEAFIGYQAIFGIGAEFKMWDDISIKAEFDYLTASNNKIDGNDHINEVKGILQSNGDSYANLSLGATWYFSRGERSKICEPFSIREVFTEVPVIVEKVIIDTVYVDNIIEKAIIKRESFVLENIRFKFDQDILTNEAEITLANVANVLKKYPDEKIEILGHTDNWGSDEYNLELSERRAISVKNKLVDQGIDADRLFTAGCGERKPVADNSTKMGRAINRRIEFSIYDGVSSKCPKVDIGINGKEEDLENAVLKGEQLVIEGVFFKFDSDELTAESEVTLNNVANVLKKYPNAKVEIQGHTDNFGDEKYNELLSKNRARSVREYLISKGIDGAQLTTVGYGETKPIMDNNTDYGRAINRRIEFNISNEDNIKIKSVKPSMENTSSAFTDGSEENKIASALEKGEKLSFTNVRFKFNSDELTEPSKTILDNVVNVLEKLTDLNLEVEGHTDSDGEELYNQDLSKRRAISVKNYLVKNGINEERLTTSGFGETNPISDNDTAEGKAKNRRIEFKPIK